ncbi:MAG: hypothetical protein AAFY08_16340 [Planctomycetota bacterium]
MSATVAIGLTDASRRVIDQWSGGPQRLAAAVADGLQRVLVDLENHVKTQAFAGSPSPGGGRVGTRTGNLRQAVSHRQDSPTSGVVGTTTGPTSAYARTILGPGRTTITPRRAKHLWVPVASNLTRTGRVRLTPREAMQVPGPRGGRALRVFRSAAGNLVAVLPGRGVMFVLKDRVEIEGTDALARLATERADVSARLLETRINAALDPSAGGER